MPKNMSPVPYQKIIGIIWPKVLAGETIYLDEVISLMIAEELLVRNHYEMTDSKSDETTRPYYERMLNQEFNRLNRHLQLEKFYRIFRRTLPGGRIRLDFQNDGIYHEERIIRLPIQALRTHSNSSKAMERQPGFVNEDRGNFIEETRTVLTAASRSFDHIVGNYRKPTRSNEPVIVPMRKAKKTASAKKAGRRKAG